MKGRNNGNNGSNDNGSANKLRVVVDGRETFVPPGTTILDAAKTLGIAIPTLCHVPGLEPSSSCFLCAVQVQGMRTFSPSCAMPVSDGMVVDTNTYDVRDSRQMALELLLSDHAGDCVAPCAVRCPAGLDIPGFLYEMASGEGQRSMDVISDTLSLPGVLGRVCPRLCEENCRRCDHDDGLAIGSLHRYVADETYDANDRFALNVPKIRSGRSVGIIGAGPAGLTAAFYLLQKGHACTLYDAHEKAGGMLRYGIPAYRLPRTALDEEIAVIERMGATFTMGVRWGEDFTLAELRERHDAVFVAIGAQGSRGLRCDGQELALSGIDFLAQVERGETPKIGKSVVVIGGGNTAMDAARTAVRLNAHVQGAEAHGADVRVFYRRTRREMPCLLEEVEGAEEEGVAFKYLAAPIRLAKRPGGLELVYQEMKLGEPDASGRRRPVPIEGSETSLLCDSVIAAVGQTVDLTLAESEGLSVTAWGLATDKRTLATSYPDVFAGGDAVLGADLAVRAVAAGRGAAASIDQLLTGQPVTGPVGWTDIAMLPIDDSERAEIFRGIEKSVRVKGETLSMDDRLRGFDEIEAGLVWEQADREARRCMTCGCRKAVGCKLRLMATEYGVDPYRFKGERRRFEQDDTHPEIVYEPGKCILCDACVRIAAESSEDLGVAIVGRGFDVSMAVPFDEPLSDGLHAVAKRCAAACPTGAIALRTARTCDLDSCAGCSFAGSSSADGSGDLVSIGIA